MSTRYTIKKGVEREIIEDFITSNNTINWISNISTTIEKDRSGVEKIVKNLADKVILERIDCPDVLIKKIKEERQGGGGAFPSDCYQLNYDMDPEWFVEIARPHFDNDIKKIKFMKSSFTYYMIRYKNFLNWVIKKRLNIDVSNEEKNLLCFILYSFPSSLQWILFGDLTIIDNYISNIKTDESEKILKKYFYFANINSKIIEDIVKGKYLQYESFSQIKYNFKTEFEFFKISSLKSKGKKGGATDGHGELLGGFSLTLTKRNNIKK